MIFGRSDGFWQESGRFWLFLRVHSCHGPEPAGLVEALLTLQCTGYGLVDYRIRHQDIVVQDRKWRIEPVDPTVCLVPVLVRIRQAVERHRVRLGAVPSL